MRRIYLIRHSRPDFPEGKKMCIGKTDLPLGAVGRMQSVLLAEGLKDREISAVYCSDLKRSIQTASYLRKEPVSKSGFQEFGCGDWKFMRFGERICPVPFQAPNRRRREGSSLKKHCWRCLDKAKETLPLLAMPLPINLFCAAFEELIPSFIASFPWIMHR